MVGNVSSIGAMDLRGDLRKSQAPGWNYTPAGSSKFTHYGFIRSRSLATQSDARCVAGVPNRRMLILDSCRRFPTDVDLTTHR
jgi:hypothetical protein